MAFLYIFHNGGRMQKIARFVECDRCGKRMDEAPLEKDGPRKVATLAIKTITKNSETKRLEEDTNVITKDLCAKCSFELASTFAQFFREIEDDTIYLNWNKMGGGPINECRADLWRTEH